MTFNLSYFKTVREGYNTEYREKHKAYYLKDIKKDITYYKKSFAKIENKFQINNDPLEVVANRLVTEFGLGSEAI